MLQISTSENPNTVLAFSERSGIPKHLLQAKLVRLGINHNGYVSFANQEYLQEIYIKEGNQEFLIKFSKMNYEQT
jgi:hypothetical protein